MRKFRVNEEIKFKVLFENKFFKFFFADFFFKFDIYCVKLKSFWIIGKKLDFKFLGWVRVIVLLLNMKNKDFF